MVKKNFKLKTIICIYMKYLNYFILFIINYFFIFYNSFKQVINLRLIMVSQSTLLKTREHIAEVIKETEFSKDDILIFIQNEIPTLSFNGNLLMKSKSVILTNPGKIN